MLRFFAKGGAIGERVALPPEEAAHARVRRVREGEEVGLVDGKGGSWLGKFEEGAICISSANPRPKQFPEIALYMGLTASSTFEAILEEATQFGVSQIIPVLTQNAFYHNADLSKLEGKRDRWEKILKESCKQSGNPFLPRLGAPLRFKEALKYSSADLTLVAAMEGTLTPWRELPLMGVPRVNLWVGPEGDFSGEEYAAFTEAKALGVGLGPNVLRAQTAALAGLARLQLVLGK
jgi:16S rRNA (uracil1498-N3)-methyltransferase